MNIIGFDFGTTNSTISYFDPKNNELENFKVSGNNNYIPTVISYKQKDSSISIGKIAKLNITNKAFEVCEHFKLRLGADAGQIMEGKTKTPFEAARDFIKELLREYKNRQRIDKIDKIVMTVPVAWHPKKLHNIAVCKKIEEIYRQLGYGDVLQLVAEPVAAASYFCWAHERNKKINPTGAKYNGALMVVDYGGGTLDVTLCSIENGEKVKVLECWEDDEKGYQANGNAGVAFDEAVIIRLIEKNNLNIEKGSNTFIKLRDKFEEIKILGKGNITKTLKLYFDNPEIVKDESLFSLECGNDDYIDVYCEDLMVCFEKINKPVLERALRKMEPSFKYYNIDTSNQDNFRVLLVGGFSNFAAVEEEVRSFFGASSIYADKRFEHQFSENEVTEVDSLLTISRGAAVIAEGYINPIKICNKSIGFIVFSKDESDIWVGKDIKVIEKGTSADEAAAPCFHPSSYRVNSKSGTVRIFVDDESPNKKGRKEFSLDVIFPNIDIPDNAYYIGFSVDEDLIPTIHIKDKYGNTEQTYSKKLIERIKIQEETDGERYA